MSLPFASIIAPVLRCCFSTSALLPSIVIVPYENSLPIFNVELAGVVNIVATSFTCDKFLSIVVSIDVFKFIVVFDGTFAVLSNVTCSTAIFISACLFGATMLNASATVNTLLKYPSVAMVAS